MSLEIALTENTKAAIALTAVLARVELNQERLLAGQETAIAKIEGAKPATARPSRTAKETTALSPQLDAAGTVLPPAGSAAQKPSVQAAPSEPELQLPKPTVTDDDIKAAAGAWMAGKSDAERNAAATFMGDLLTEFGLAGTKLTGPQSKLDDEQRRQTLFFLKRKAAGLPVDFKADYDFSSDPTKENEPQGGVDNDPLG